MSVHLKALTFSDNGHPQETFDKRRKRSRYTELIKAKLLDD